MFNWEFYNKTQLLITYNSLSVTLPTANHPYLQTLLESST